MALTFVKSSRGADQLFYEGFLFTRDKQTETRTHWKCTKYNVLNCKARVQTEGGAVIKKSNCHTNHTVESAEVRAKIVICEIKEKAKSSSQTPQQMVA